MSTKGADDEVGYDHGSNVNLERVFFENVRAKEEEERLKSNPLELMQVQKRKIQSLLAEKTTVQRQLAMIQTDLDKMYQQFQATSILAEQQFASLKACARDEMPPKYQ